MGCGGYACSRNTLCVLNILYMLVSLLLIGVGIWGKWFGLVSSFQVVGAIVGVGVFLFIIATMGLCGALRHHQVFLFFYMFILFLVFVVQFSVSCACLAVNKDQQEVLLSIGWSKSEAMQSDLERTLNCCGFFKVDYNGTCAADCFKAHQCEPCLFTLQQYADDSLRFVGGTSLFFSFTEILGVWITYRYRNQKDPRINPQAFI